ncbi:MAG TPA: hypothetical protein VIV11_09865, partial [Kofleriaceae bacterium]
ADSDCNTAAGEECFEGLCYGDPPLGVYAAALSSPVTREDLIATELPILMLPRNGDLGPLALEAPITFSGRVEASCGTMQMNCSTMSIGGQVRITRPSRIPGGPALRLVAISKSDVPRGTDSFSIHLPPMHPGDPPYTITIDPEGGGDMPPTHGSKDPAQIVPPKRFVLDETSAFEHQTYTLGTNPVTISGALKDGLGATLTKYRVAALGRWDANAAPTEVSSVHYSTDGTYSIAISEGVVGAVELVARPYDSLVVAPELRVGAVDVYTQTKNIYQPTGLGTRVDVSIPIEALSGDGGVKPVSGARVVITGSIESGFPNDVRAVMIAETTTGDDGHARLSLLDGDALLSTYQLRVVPPGSSSAGIIFNEPFALPVGKVRLPQRVAIRGKLVDTAGEPLADVSVTARRSLRFLWSLDGTDQPFLDEIPAATAITPETGDFVIWLDPAVGTTWGHYDLFFETPDHSAAPNWLISDLEIPRIPGQMTIDLEDVTIPDAAYLHGSVVDPNGGPVDGSELRIFRLSDNESVCREAANAPLECSDDARVMGHGESDDAGIVRLTLPRP